MPKRVHDGVGLSQSGEGLLAQPQTGAVDRHDLSFLLPAEMPDEIGRLGAYRVLKILGEGGMGLVLQAHDPGLDRIVALKVMHARQAQNPRSKQRFLVEARAVAKVEHEHIVPIYQVGEERGLPFIAMAYLEGETLGQRIKREAPFSWQEAARITREVAKGLAIAHAKGLIHRDIKPANIWLDTPAGPKKPARARILDFGLVRNTKDSSTRVTQLGAVLGTPAYMSPEQAMSEEVDERTDLFSVGVMLYEMCTGKRPFPGQSIVEIMSAIASDTPKPIRELNQQIPEGLAQLAVKLLEKDRERRLKSAEQLVHAIELVERDAAHNFARKENPAAEKPASNAFAFNEPAQRVPGVSRRDQAPTETYAATPTPRSKTAVRRGVPMWFWFAGATLLATLVVTLIVMFRGPAAAVVNNDKPEPKDKGSAVKPPSEQKTKPAPPVAGATPKVGDVITNSIGIKLTYVPAGKFMMGSPESDADAWDNEKPQHQVEIRKGFYIGVYEVTQEEYQSLMETNPSAYKGNRQPVDTVSWNDAKEFCRELTKKEKKTYRLPTEAEWEYACRAGTSTRFQTGTTLTQPQANFQGISTREVGRYTANAYGIHDMHGNVWEWCEDWYNPEVYAIANRIDQLGPPTGDKRVLRGGGVHSSHANCRSAARIGNDPVAQRNDMGFRVVLEVASSEKEPPVATPEVKASAAVPPATITTPKAGDVITCSIGMKLAYIPAGKFMMGSPASDTDAQVDEKPQHQVELTKGFYLGVHEVTQEEYESVMGTNPSSFKGGNRRPVESLTWHDAKEFCRKLAVKEGKKYRLPTEAEWEYACRAGTTTRFNVGDSLTQAQAHFGQPKGPGRTISVGLHEANAFGLFDMHGNVWEWCEDCYSADEYAKGDRKDPKGPSAGDLRVRRGGGWISTVALCRSAHRIVNWITPATRDYGTGMRVALDAEPAATKPPATGVGQRFPGLGAPAGPNGDMKIFLSDLNEYGWYGAGYFSKNGKRTDGPIFDIAMKGVKYTKGLFTHPPLSGFARIKYRIDSSAADFCVGGVGLNDSVNACASPLTFQVICDGAVRWSSKPVQFGKIVQSFRVDVRGVKELELKVLCPGAHGRAHAVWLDPLLIGTKTEK